MNRKLRMNVQNEQFTIGSVKMNSISNSATVLIGDACLITPQTESITQPQQQPQQINTESHFS